ncbi:unnamed protein product [Moneuplotes crassus]|uniref:Uncharacterized protein n=1 Tax=Euplotes crassus TaxID=5936 RepID=A0AAD1XES3_EUPCR|nr:unnamed protein product [Moneuplotes crassus]
MTVKDLDAHIEQLKYKILEKIDNDAKSLRNALQRETLFNSEANNELGVLENIVNEVNTLSLRTVDISKFKEIIDKHVEDQGAAKIKEFFKNEKLCYSKWSIQDIFILNCNSTMKNKFSEFMKKTLKDTIYAIL